MSPHKPADNKIERLEKLTRHLESVLARTERALYSASDLGNFQISISKQEDPEKILSVADGKVRQVLDFEWTAFFLFDEKDASLYLAQCSPRGKEDLPEKELDHLLKNRALDLEDRQPVFVVSTDGKQRLLLKILATESRIRGVFMGLPVTPFNEIHDSSLALVSLVLLNCANTIESVELYKMNRQTLEDLRESEERYRLLADNAHDVIWAMDGDRRVTYVSPSCRYILKCTEQEFVERFLDSLLTEESKRFLVAALGRCLGSERSFEERLELEVRTDDDQCTWAETLISRVKEKGNPNRIMGVMRDVSQRKKYEEKLKHLAMHDPLTELPNRTLFTDRLNQAIARSHRWENYKFAVMMIDLDGYKYVNDNYGHHVGDLLLRLVGRRIQECVREVDTVSRVGGDEFSILLDDFQHPSQVVQVARRIKQGVAQPYVVDGNDVSITCSLGLVHEIQGYKNHEEILRDADISMYRAKELGGNRVRAFKRGLRDRHMHALQLERDLLDAVERKSFQLHYQPVYDLVGEALVGFEALVRWPHPSLGLLQPSDFIPLAEKNGSIVKIGEQVLEMACAKIAMFQKTPETSLLFVSVNVSGRQITGSLANMIERTIHSHGVNPSNLEIELTETAIIENLSMAIELFEKIRELGVKVAIDDFGTGYSSLSYLQSFMVDFLKLDRSFVARIKEDKNRDVRIVRAIVALAETLGFKVIAEGIELVEQRNLLREMGCYAGQGFHYSKPVGEDQLDDFFKNANRGDACPG